MRIMQPNWPDTLILAREKESIQPLALGQSQHSPPSGREAPKPIRGSSTDLPSLPVQCSSLRVQVQDNGLLAGEPGMAKVIIRHVFHNFKRTRKLMLGHVGMFLQLVLHHLRFSSIIGILVYS